MNKTSLLCLLWILGALSAFAVEGDSVQPFAPASRSTTGKRFTRLPETATGLVVRNAYDDPEMWGNRYKEFMSGAMGTGIAVGDFDQDGRPDLYVVTKTGQGRLFRNLGNWKFADVTVTAGLADPRVDPREDKEGHVIWHQGAVFADVNNDGLPDLYVCRNGAPNLLYINQGAGKFREEAAARGLALVSGSGVAAFCDYDRDGWLDCYVQTNLLDANRGGQGERDHLYHNNGDGTFTEVSDRAGIRGETMGHSLLWFDYNGDGWPDLFVANDFAAPDQLYRNNHDGTFTDVVNEAFPHTSFSSMGSDVGDINNDGLPDLFVADMAPTSREKDLRGLASSRSRVWAQPETPGVALQFMQNMLFRNTGRGVFAEEATLRGVVASDWTWSVRFEDFDNDGFVDLHVTNGMPREAANADVLRRMMGAESDAERILAMKTGPVLSESHLTFRNTGNGFFEPAAAAWGLEDSGVSFGSATADFDGDGDLDLVYIDHDGGLVVYRNDTTDGNSIQISLTGTRSNRFGVGAVLVAKSQQGLQRRELLTTRGYLSGSELLAHFGLGKATALESVTISWPSGSTQVLTNLAAGNRYHVVEPKAELAKDQTSKASPLVFTEVKAPRGLLASRVSVPVLWDRGQALLPFRSDRGGPSLAVADVDSDGTEDVVVSGTSGSGAEVFFKRGDDYQKQPAPWTAEGMAEEGPLLVLDADGDGINDLLITRAGVEASAGSSAYQPQAWKGKGNGRFEQTTWLPSLPVSAGALCAADWTHEGHFGLFLGGRVQPGQYPLPPKSALLRWQNGTYEDVTASAPGLEQVGLVKGALFSDVDGDGWSDLLVASEWGKIRYFHNNQKGGFEEWTDQSGFGSPGVGLWGGIVAGDFNGDGRLDYAVGNVGLNTRFRPPFRLYYGAFAGNGTKQVVEAVREGTEWYPVRGLAELGSRLPPVAKKFQSNDLFSRARINDLFSERSLTNAKVFELQCAESGVFLSQADGTYKWRPFPREAQGAPLQGLATGDFDGDGILDLCATQNAHVTLPYLDGGVGVFLHGVGDGSFVVRTPEESGFLVTGDAKGLAVVPTNSGAPFRLLATRAQGESLLLVPASLPASQTLAVRLRGTPGNATAVGSRVTLVLSDGSRVVRETSAGSGWRTQESASLVFGYKPNVKPVSLEIVWPRGQRSSVPVNGETRLEVPEPQ